MRYRLVDRILSHRPRTSITGLKAVSFEEAESQRELGRPPALPASLMIEAMFQLANWLILLSTDFEKMGLVVSCRRIETLRLLRLGETMRLTVRWVASRDEAALFEGEGRVGEELVLRGEGCAAHLVSAADFERPEDLRILHEEISQTEGGRP